MGKAEETNILNVILVNYNQYRYTASCLDSIVHAILRCSSLVRVIVVDNSENRLDDYILKDWIERTNKSFENEPEEGKIVCAFTKNGSKSHPFYSYVGRECSSVLVIRQKHNKGFASANNFALSFLLDIDDWSHVWLLNNDTIIDQHAIHNLLSSLPVAETDRVGLWGTKLFNYGSFDVLQAIGGKYFPLIGSIKHIGANQFDSGQFDNISSYEKVVSYPIGASMIVSRKFIEEIGLLEEDYFLYFEELDWVLRGKKKGWRIAFLPFVKVQHIEGGSISGKSEGSSLLADKCNIVNRIKIALKFYPWTLPLAIGASIIMILNRLKKGRWERVWPLVKSAVLLKVN